MALTVEQMRQWSMANPNASDAERFQWMRQNGITPEMLAPAAGVSLPNIYSRYNAQLQNAGMDVPAANENQIRLWLEQNPNATIPDIFTAMQKWNISPEQFSQATGKDLQNVYSKYNEQAQLNNLPTLSSPQNDTAISGEYIPAPSSGTGYAANLGPSNTPYGQYLNFGDGYGLSGAEDAIRGGAVGGLGTLQYTANRVGDAFQSGIEGLNPYMQTGGTANARLADLTGLSGADAQTAALADYQESPWVDQVRQNAERGILRNASATGNLGSGNTLDQLYRNSADLFLGDYYNQLGVMQGTADRGLSASGTAGGLYSNLGGAYAGLGSQAATIPVNAGNTTGAYRYQAGRDLSSNISAGAAGQAQYLSQQGAGIADIVGNTTNNINSLLQAAYGGDATAKQNLMSLLTGLSTQTGAQVSSLPIISGGQTNYLGQIGQLASGLGGLATGLSNFQNPSANSPASGMYYNNVSPTDFSGYV